MAYRLPNHLGVCEIGARTLMLDLRRDRYLQLDARAARAFTRWRNALQTGLTDEAATAELVGRGWLLPVPAGPDPGAPVRRIPPRSVLGELPHVPVTMTGLRDVVAALWRCRARLRRRGLEAAVEEVRRARPHDGDRSSLTFHLAAFRAARRLVPIAPNCLTDSLALSAFLAARGLKANLVFGVKLDPFAAHCWLQDEEAILNDAADSVTDFTPILTV